ncbi:hypothetical protein ACFLWZ_05800 [Chloroflexota bacterium]
MDNSVVLSVGWDFHFIEKANGIKYLYASLDLYHNKIPESTATTLDTGDAKELLFDVTQNNQLLKREAPQ